MKFLFWEIENKKPLIYKDFRMFWKPKDECWELEKINKTKYSYYGNLYFSYKKEALNYVKWRFYPND